MDQVRSLEEELKERASQGGDAEDFLMRYENMKQYLAQNYYPWIQATCPFYTDHGQLHIESVTRAASELLANTQKLDHLSLFLILAGIIWHDAAMVYDRTEHADIREMTEKIRELAFPSVTIQRLVEEIARAHAGEDGLSVPQYEQDCSTRNGQYTVKPKALAAILRFADEISENRTRMSLQLLREGKVPEENQLYWEYANCIAASRGDAGRERVVVTIEIDKEVAGRRHSCPSECSQYAGSDNSIALIEYVIYRLEKMNNELWYCSREFRQYSGIDDINVRLTLLDGTSRMNGYQQDFGMRDLAMDSPSYPRIGVLQQFFDRFPHWKPDNIATGT